MTPEDFDLKRYRKRAEAAWMQRRQYDAMLRDVYDYVLPLRDITGLHVSGGRTEGERRVDKVFDATAMKAAFRFAGRLQTELTPLFQSFFSLEAGPLLPDDDNKKELTEQLQDIGRKVEGVLASGEFHNAAHEMYLDLYAGTGAMQVLEGDTASPVRVRVVPIPEIALEEGPFGSIWGIYWKRKWRASELKVLWKDGNFSESLKQAIDNNADTPVEVCQYTYFDPEKKSWRLLVWTDRCEDKDKKPFYSDNYRTNPWITPRFMKVPGEPYGRGPAQLAMPFIKTANKARELALKAAALSVMGIWMRRNDNVFNPDTVRFEPLAMWTVASTGGPLGPTIQRLPVPQDFDVSSIVMADEREQMKMALFDETLPPPDGAVRSATEIAERMRRLSQDLAGVYGRLTLEIVVPLVQRVVDILEKKSLINAKGLQIDQMVTQARVVAPIAAGQQAARVQSYTNWLQMLQLLGGPGYMQKIARTETIGQKIGRWSGVDEMDIRSSDEIKQITDREEALQAQMMQAEIAKSQPEVPPQQPLVNGGGV